MRSSGCLIPHDGLGWLASSASLKGLAQVTSSLHSVQPLPPPAKLAVGLSRFVS